jgi:predicted Ser/Thr protein kinase
METRTCPRCSSWFSEGQVREEFSGICPKCLSESLADAPAVSPLEAGTRFGGFELLEILGRGGMGVVYKARQTSLDRIVALKVLAPGVAGDPDFAGRFDREAKLLASVNHPNVVQVHDFGREGGVHFLVMEYVDGESLDDAFRRGGLEPARLTRVLRDVARGLSRIHGVGLVHRDLKPANILLARDGSAKIGDFGLAVGSGTRAGDQSYFIGSPHYASPEQARGAPVDARSDLYALGVILYEGFEGRPPFESTTPQALLAKHLEDPVPPMSRAPAKIQSLVRALLQKAPADRPATSEKVAESLDRVLGPRFWLRLVVGAAVVLLVLAAGIWRLRTPARWVAPEEQGWKDLLKGVDPQRDRVSGNWAWDDGTLVSDATERAKLMLRYDPPAEYDYRVFFSRIQGIGDVNLLLSKGGRSFAWCMGGMGNTQAGFGSINRKWAPEKGNPSRVKLAIEPGIVYEARVEVRNSGVRAFVNGSKVCEWATDYSDFSLEGPWSLHDEAKIGLGTFTSPTRFHGMQVREVR